LLHSAATLSNDGAPPESCPALIPTVRTRKSRPRVRQQVFADLLQLPSIDRLLKDKSIELIQQRSVQDWSLAGGVVRPDGEPTLGQPSVAAFRLLRDTIQTHGGFWYTDSVRTHWAVLLPDNSEPDEGHWRGVGLGFEFLPALLDPRIRRRELEGLKEMLSQSKPHVRSLGPGLQARHAERTRTVLRLQQLDHALNLMPLVGAAGSDLNSSITELDVRRLAKAIWGGKENDWSADWIEATFEGVAGLGRIHVQELELPKTGWHPQPLQRTAAVQLVRRVTPDRLALQIAPIFNQFTALWMKRHTSAIRQ
jgi:hypothetical protein